MVKNVETRLAQITWNSEKGVSKGQMRSFLALFFEIVDDCEEVIVVKQKCSKGLANTLALVDFDDGTKGLLVT